MLADLGRPALDEGGIRDYIGKGVVNLVHRCLEATGGATEEDRRRALEVFERPLHRGDRGPLASVSGRGRRARRAGARGHRPGLRHQQGRPLHRAAARADGIAALLRRGGVGRHGRAQEAPRGPDALRRREARRGPRGDARRRGLAERRAVREARPDVPWSSSLTAIARACRWRTWAPTPSWRAWKRQPDRLQCLRSPRSTSHISSWHCADSCSTGDGTAGAETPGPTAFRPEYRVVTHD